MVTTLAYLPFRAAYAPTKLVGRVVAWLAEGYRAAPLLERVLIFPSWALFRSLFLVGWSFSHVLHSAARRAVWRAG